MLFNNNSSIPFKSLNKNKDISFNENDFWFNPFETINPFKKIFF